MSGDAIVISPPLPTFKLGAEHVWRQTLEQDPPSPDPLTLLLWEIPDHFDPEMPLVMGSKSIYLQGNRPRDGWHCPWSHSKPVADVVTYPGQRRLENHSSL